MDNIIELNNDDAITLSVKGYIDINDTVFYRDRSYDSFHKAYSSKQAFEIIAQAGNLFYILSPMIGKNQVEPTSHVNSYA